MPAYPGMSTTMGSPLLPNMSPFPEEEPSGYPMPSALASMLAPLPSHAPFPSNQLNQYPMIGCSPQSYMQVDDTNNMH